MAIGLYVFLAFIVSLAFGIPRTWLALERDEDLFRATLDGGLLGVSAGLLWPVSIWVVLIGLIAFHARDKWKAAQGGKKDELQESCR